MCSAEIISRRSICKRLTLSDDIDALFFDRGLKCVKCGVAVDNLVSKFWYSFARERQMFA